MRKQRERLNDLPNISKVSYVDTKARALKR